MSITEAAVSAGPTLPSIIATLRSVDPSAFAVAPRVLRRVLRSEFELRALWTRVPHRYSYTIPRDRLMGLVAADELGVDDLSELPDRVILLAIPEDAERDALKTEQIATWFHRHLFHARIHLALDSLQISGRLTRAGFRDRIGAIGSEPFDEVRTVLDAEHCLPPDATLATVYVEFAAVWLEFVKFSPKLLPKWFPSLTDHEHITALLQQDVDANELFEATHIEGSSAGIDESHELDFQQGELPAPRSPWPWEHWFPRRTFRRRTRAARAIGHRGNDVRAAILWKTAEPFAQPEELPEIEAALESLVRRLTQRLAAALEFSETQAEDWAEVIRGLMMNSTRGFWNADARLLYDLQKVCLDHERQISAVDLVGWITSFGRKPLKRSLPNQREVLMSKHLSIAARRIPAVKLPGPSRRKLTRLLESAAASAEQQLRRRLKPLIAEALTEVGLHPVNIPERVAFRKIVDELLDAVVRQGYLSMGDLRDAISRSSLKLQDLSGIREAVSGDELLRADCALDAKLDGVYRRGEIYLRGLQRLSAVAFGTTAGRRFVLFLAIPYGGAYVVIEGLSHLLMLIFAEEPKSKYNILPATRHFLGALGSETVTRNALSLGILALFALGTILLLVIHWRLFRSLLTRLFTSFYHVLRGLAWDFPKWLLRLDLIRALLRHPVVTMLRRWLVQPAIVTGLLWLALPWLGATQRPGWLGTLPIFLALAFLLNSRTGRDIEEVLTEQIERTWHLIRIHIFVALFDAIMESFKRFLDFVEKILYEVDEFLRFRSGEGIITLVVKGVLGVIWSVVTFVVRFCVTLLIEPQVNPIKHFPVVTVSHKILLPLAFTKNLAVDASPLAYLLMQIFPMTVSTANGVAATVVWGIPGIFGFLVWELRENWRLYAANRLPVLTPAIVGDRGETIPRLLTPGFHSGTIPKLHARRRRSAHFTTAEHRREGELTYQHRLQGLQTSVARYVHRELIVLLEESRSFEPGELRVAGIEVGLSSLRIRLACPSLSEELVEIEFAAVSGWIVAEVNDGGWLHRLPRARRSRFETALMGFYRISGVDIVREQISGRFGLRLCPYDILEADLIFWPGSNYEADVRYHLAERPAIRPRPRHLAETFLFPRLEARELLFNESPVEWNEWLRSWEGADLAPESMVNTPIRDVVLLPPGMQDRPS